MHWLARFWTLQNGEGKPAFHHVTESRFCFFGRIFGFFPGFTLCCGGDFATTSTARSKRSQASGRNSSSFFGPGLAMPHDLYPRIYTDEYYLALGRFVSDFSEVEQARLAQHFNASFYVHFQRY
jgi:hypothetical protein